MRLKSSTVCVVCGRANARTILKPRHESIAAAAAHLKSEGVTPEELAPILALLSIRPVFTRHPTEVRRRSLLVFLEMLRACLAEREGKRQDLFD